MAQIGSVWAQPSWLDNVWGTGTWANAFIPPPSETKTQLVGDVEDLTLAIAAKDLTYAPVFRLLTPIVVAKEIVTTPLVIEESI